MFYGSMPAAVSSEPCMQAMELLGPSLWDEWNARGAGGMPVPFVACVAVEALRILQGLHQKGCATDCFFFPFLYRVSCPQRPSWSLRRRQCAEGLAGPA